MIAPASPADWLQGLTMTTLLGGVAIAFSRTLRLDEPTFDDATSRPWLASQSSSAPSTRRSWAEGTK